MSERRVHVVGAGMAGLSAATALAEKGIAVTLYESAPHAGGRCRSYDDPQLGIRIDNGNHLVLSGNHAARSYLARIGASASVDMPPPIFPFKDLATGEAWCLDIGPGRLPLWLFSKHRRVPETSLGDYLSLFRLRNCAGRTVAEVLGDTGSLYRRFWSPFARAVLNTEPEAADASLLWPVVQETLLQGGDACRPLLAKNGLGASFVDPALDYLRRRGGTTQMGARVREVRIDAGRVTALQVDSRTIEIDAAAAVIIAVPPLAAGQLLPGVPVPTEFRAILNAHFRLPSEPKAAPITGFVGGLSEWLFLRGAVASVTVSAANAVIDDDADALGRQIWREIAPVLGFEPDSGFPLCRIVKEKRATFAATPGQAALRPAPGAAGHGNLALAGDWTGTGLPATIEGAIRSGSRAAGLVLDQMIKF